MLKRFLAFTIHFMNSIYIIICAALAAIGGLWAAIWTVGQADQTHRERDNERRQ